MFYKSYNISPEWRKQINDNPLLSDEEKREIIKRAEAQATSKTVKSAFISMIITIIAMIIYGLISG